MKSYGLEVRIDEIVVPIPEFMLEFVIDNNAITFYRADNEEYMWEPLLSVEIPRDGLIEARGAYKFIQNSNSGRKEADGDGGSKPESGLFVRFAVPDVTP